jgi:hypothetical protein
MNNKKSAKVVHPTRKDKISTSCSSSYSYEPEGKVPSLGKTHNFNPVSNMKAASVGTDSGLESLSLGDLILSSDQSTSSQDWKRSPSQASKSSNAKELSSASDSSLSSSPSAGFSSKCSQRNKDSKDLKNQIPSSDSEGNSRDADSNPSTASGSPPTFTPITPFPTERPVNAPTFPPSPQLSISTGALSNGSP